VIAALSLKHVGLPWPSGNDVYWSLWLLLSDGHKLLIFSWTITYCT